MPSSPPPKLPSDISEDTSISPTAFLPPSIDTPKLLRGETYTYYSPIPSEILSNPTAPVILGIDEAGRGPVLGPMVYAAAYCLSSYSDTIKGLGFTDSKKLTPTHRSTLLSALCDSAHPTATNSSIGWSTTLLSPLTISTGMLRPPTHQPYNLNALAHDTTINLIQAIISMGVNVKEIYVDTVGVAATYQLKLATLFPACKVVVEKQADSSYPVVSAASVCAKVTRDMALEQMVVKTPLDEEEGKDLDGISEKQAVDSLAILGSGYPGDAKTIAYLRENLDPVFGWRGEVVRFSWATARDMLEKPESGGVKVEWAEPIEDGDQNIVGFFSGEKDAGVGGWYGKTVLAGVDF